MKALKRELIEQPTDGNMNPMFWRIMETGRLYGQERDSSNGWIVWDGEGLKQVGDSDDEESVIRELVEKYWIDEHVFDKADSDIEKIVELANSNVARAQERGTGYTKFSLNYYARIYWAADGPLFLTKQACLEYIRKHGLNHHEPHSYVMPAFKCPEYEMLLDIIKSIDWDAVTSEK